jgi:beta-galactosidase/beta-glucuronidase
MTRHYLALLASTATLAMASISAAQGPAAAQLAGPYNVEFPAGGDGLAKASSVTFAPNGPWTLQGWIKPERLVDGRSVIAGVGDERANGRFLILQDGKLGAAEGASDLPSRAVLKPGVWTFVAAVSDGTHLRLYVDGRQVAEGKAAKVAAASKIQLAPRQAAGAPFAGRIAGFTAAGVAASAAELAAAAKAAPSEVLINFETGSPTWPVQTRAMAGQLVPQDPWTLPKSKAAPSAPVAKPAYAGPALVAASDREWTLKSWKLIEGPKLAATGAEVSRPGYDAGRWYAATVPGTVLTTLVDRGVYPDPDYGLNNLAIPESLNKQDYWYRSEFAVPAALAGKRLALNFKGINYAAEVWVNGVRLGDIKGAFIRGRFDISQALRPGATNVVAVKISPPPHPGLPQEESLAAGPGENGGMMLLDGPTFVASEGWDWIPSVRDRNTGLWQDVTLRATGEARIGDAQIVTTLPKADNSVADIEITAPIENLSDAPVAVEVTVAFDGVSAIQRLTAPPGVSSVRFVPKDFPQLSVKNPRLWWPNGYGEPALHDLRISAAVAGAVSDETVVRFGMRQVTYELSLMDQKGELRRVEVDLTKARSLGQDVIDASHQGIRKVADGWVYSLTAGAETSPAVRALKDTALTPYMVIKVNGERIAAKGGNWGMDDWRKRVSRERLEPYFRLHRDAHVNVIRNWVGQNTQESFYDLADEYGLMVLNDFWASTQNYNLEPADVPLFLANARDTIARYRNHPSVVLWFGRNEGVPQPILNEGLETLVHDLDGTRNYMGTSNTVNLQGSGPYNYREPGSYFTDHAKGFSVEVGTPSFPTLESFKAATPASEQWPISDTWAYLDWHSASNGATKTFEDAMALKYGAPASLEDFERKAQLMNYETYRAIFEGMNAKLWTQNSGRMLWMTQPARPSTHWQVLSHDYDTHAAFYGLQKGSEPVHVQMNLPDYGLTVVNNTAKRLSDLSVKVQVVGLDGAVVAERADAVSVGPDSVGQLQPLALAALLEAREAVVVQVVLAAKDGAVLSRNTYWQARDPASSRALSSMDAQPVALSAAGRLDGAERVVTVRLRNTGARPSLNNKLTLLDDQGGRILPAYYGDNYVSLLPGEDREVTIRYPAALNGAPRVALRGWNTTPATVSVAPF